MMHKRRRTIHLTSDRYSTQQEIQTPELPQIMRQSRPRTRSQTTPQSESDPLSQPQSESLIEQQCSSQPQSHSHVEQKDYSHSQGSRHVETQLEAPTGPQIDGSAELHPCPEHLGQIQSLRVPSEELSDGLHNYIEGQDATPTKSQQETPGKLQVAPVDLVHNPQYLRQVKYRGSSSTMTILGSSVESKGTRGSNRLSRIWNLPEGYKVGVQFDSNFHPIKREGGLLKRFLGTAARKSHLLPIHYKTWLKVPSVYKQGLWDLIKSKFEIPIAHERDIEKVILQKMGYMWRGYKCYLKAHYFDENKSVEEMIANVPPRVDKEQWASLVALWNTSDMKTLCQNNKALRQHQKIRHTTGTKSFAEIAEEMKEKDGVAPSEAELFILTHKRKDGTALNEDSAKKIAEMEKLLAQHQENSQSTNEDIGSQDDADADGGGDDDVDDDDDPDYDDINSQVIEKETNDHVRSLRLGNTPSRNTSYLSPTVVSARIGSDTRQMDIETMKGSHDSRQVEKDRKRVVKDRGMPQKNGRGKDVIDESVNFVRVSSTRSRNTSDFSPIVAIARMVSEDNTREAVGERMITHDRKRVEKDMIRVKEDRRRAEETREERNGYEQGLSVGITPSNARIITEKDMRQVDERMIRAYEKERKQVEEDRKRVEEDRRKVEEDRRQVEEDRRQAQEDRMQAEEDRRKAEEERKKSDAEIKFLKERLTWMENLVSKLLPSTNCTNPS